MEGTEMTTRSAARAAAREAARESGEAPRKTNFEKARPLVFGVIVVAVLAAGAYFAFGDFLNRPAATAAGSDTINVQSSMAGFTPSEIRVKAGSTVKLDWWTQDASVHLQDGVHTMVSPDLGLDEALPAESSRVVSWTVPDKPGTYDVYCDSCCGGKGNPQMHGKIVVEPAA
jgi:cytochrome c oxidase subunit 2